MNHQRIWAVIVLADTIIIIFLISRFYMTEIDKIY